MLDAHAQPGFEDRAAVGVIGLGTMGAPIARRLLSSGRDVIAYDPVSAALEPVVSDGARAAHSPAAVAAAADLIVTSLPGEQELREVLFGDGGIVGAAVEPTTVVDMSTVSSAASVAFEEELRSGHIAFLDAPVSGGPAGVTSGTLIVMIGGEALAVERATPVLEALGRVFPCGGPGSGQICKACNQLIVIGTIELVAEALVFASAAGLDPALVRSALLGGYAGSRVLELHGDRMLARNFTPGGRVKFNVKDIAAIRSVTAARGLDLPAFEAAAAQINRLVDSGGGDLDNSALITLVEHSDAVTQ
jgi:2-hydroxy-3-oxopropionate reductase